MSSPLASVKRWAPGLQLSQSWRISALHLDLVSAAWLATVLLLSYFLITGGSIKRKYAPGPRGLPILGNVFQLSENVWISFNEWKKRYGPIVYINILGQPVVILNTYKAAADLLDRRSNIYSDRAKNVVVHMLTGGNSIGLMGFSDLWRRMHRAASEGLNKSIVNKFCTIQSAETAILVHDLLNDPPSWDKHLRRAGTSIISTIVYGLPTLTSPDDPEVVKIDEHIMRLVHSADYFSHLVNVFPVMRYLPSWMAKWKRYAEEWYEKDSAMHERMYNDARTRNLRNGDQSNLAAMISNGQERNELNDRQAAWLASQIYSAGSESTPALLAWFLLMMLHYPEVQKKSQAELDAVVGASRMPTFADFEHLHYVRAIIREMLRWTSLGPVATPHRSMQDDWYEGYFIPEGTICFPNLMGMNRDPEVWGLNADEFDPSRHLDGRGRIGTAPMNTKDEGHATFGFGRRICPGRYLASNTIFIEIASILWACNIEPARDEKGESILPSASVDECINTGLTIRPLPFNCSITPRFPFTKSVVLQTKESYGY